MAARKHAHNGEAFTLFIAFISTVGLFVSIKLFKPDTYPPVTTPDTLYTPAPPVSIPETLQENKDMLYHHDSTPPAAAQTSVSQVHNLQPF